MTDNHRLSLGKEFEALLGNDHVYFQPPESLKIKYDCIIYSLAGGRTRFANDKPYKFRRVYDVTYITKKPDSELVDQIATHFPMIEFTRHYTSDNLHHYAYRIWW